MLPRLHLLTHDELLADPRFPERAGALVEIGGERLALHLRGPRTPGGRLFELGELLLGQMVGTGACLLVNDRIDVALALRPSRGEEGGRWGPGVHLGARSLPPLVARALLGPGRVGTRGEPTAWPDGGPDVLLGRSIHARGETTGAGLDYLMVGTLYRTPSHPGREPAGPDFLERMVASTDLPLVGVGGVTPSRARALRRRGAHGVAVIRGVWDAPDPVAALEAYLDALRIEGGPSTTADGPDAADGPSDPRPGRG